MAIYRLNLKKGTTVTATSDVRGTKSKAKYEYNTRSGNYAERGDLVYTEDFNFKELDYDPKKFWLMSEDRTIINYDYTSYKEFKLTLPSELSNEENIELARKFCEETFGDKFLYTISIHNPAFNNNPNKNAKGEKNIHAHIMFCLKEVDLDNKMPMEQFFKYNNWRDKDRPEELRTGGAKINQWMNSTKARKNEKGEKELTFLQTSRELWENVLNAGLEKYNTKNKDVPNFEPIEPVSCKTLKQQRDEALKNGDLAKATSLDRPPINIPKRLYWKKNKGNLTNKDKRLWKKQNEISELKVTKDKEYNDYKNEKGEKTKDIQVFWDSIYEYEMKINKANSSKPSAKVIEESVVNIATHGDYFDKKNKLRYEKDLLKRKELQNTMKYLKSETRKKDNFKELIENFSVNYDKKISKEVTKLELEQEALIKKFEQSDFYNPKTDKVGSANYEYYINHKQQMEQHLKGNKVYKTNDTSIKEQLDRVEVDTLDSPAFKEYRTLLNELNSLKEDLKVQHHYLKQNPGFLEKRKINKEIVEINKKITIKNNKITNSANYKLFITTVAGKKTAKGNEINVADTKTNNERNPKPPTTKELATKNAKKSKKQGNSKSEGGYSVSVEPTEIEEMAKEPEHSR